MSTLRRFEFLEHTADIIVKAYGATLDEAFAAAAEGMFAVITGEAEIVASRREVIEVESIDREGLLVAFLSELIVRHESESVVLGDVDVTLLDKTHLRAEIGIAPFDASRHGEGVQVKGVSYHMMEIVEPSDSEPASVQVLFDI
ncbi:archease [bacterium]|nr:archease [bacterium]